MCLFSTLSQKDSAAVISVCQKAVHKKEIKNMKLSHVCFAIKEEKPAEHSKLRELSSCFD